MKVGPTGREASTLGEPVSGLDATAAPSGDRAPSGLEATAAPSDVAAAAPSGHDAIAAPSGFDATAAPSGVAAGASPGLDATAAPSGLRVRTPAALDATAAASGLDATARPSSPGRAPSGLDATAPSGLDGAGGGGAELPVVAREHYTRLDEFARGGLGRIVRARDERTGRIVALKEILELGNDDVARRFAREARVTANLMHPAIVPVYELGRWPSGEPFYAMKLVAGRSLKQVIDETTTFAERLAKLSLVIAVADALAYAHDQRVIHRDLKPANILVGDFGETVVIDWGLAKVIGSADDIAAPAIAASGPADDHTVAGAIMGTPFYMPPEQALGHAADERADVYAIGAILYHLITGDPPFADRKPKDIAQLLVMVSTSAPTPLVTREPTTPADLVTIVQKAMAPTAEDRYPSAAELAAELRRFAAGQLVTSHRYSRRALAWRWVRRHRAAVTVGAVLVAVLAASSIVAVRKIIDERDRSVLSERVASEAADRARRGLATALFQKGRGAELEQRWAFATMYYAASRTHVDTPEARWAAALAEARSITPHARHVGHGSAVNAMALTADGERAISVDHAGAIRAWSTSDGRLLASRTLAGSLWSIAIAPDGREVVVGGDAGIIHRLSLELEPLGELRGHEKRVWSLAYSPDGALLASASEDTTIRLWSATGEPRVLRGHAQRVYSVAFSPDGAQLASGSDDREVRLWSITAPGGDVRVVGTHVGGGIRVVAFTPDGGSVLSTGWNHEIKLWQLAGKTPSSWRDRHSVHAAALTPDGRAVITAGDSGAIRIWEASTRALVTTLDAHGGRTSTLVVSRDGRWLASAGQGRVPIVYDLGAVSRLVDDGGHRAPVTSIAFTARGDGFVTGSDDLTIRVWSPQGEELRRMTTGPASCNESARFLGGVDDIIVAACNDHKIRRWRAGVPLADLPLTRYLDFISIHDNIFFGGHLGGVLHQIDLETGRLLRDRKLHAHQLYVVAHARDGTLMTAGLDNEVKLWTPALDPIRSFRARTTDGLLAAAISPDGRLVAAGGQDGTLDAWDATSGRVLAQLAAHEGVINEMVFSPDGSHLFTAGDDDRVVKIWSTATWTQLGALDATEGGTQAVGISPDGRLLVSGHRSGGLVIWDVATRRPRYRIGGQSRDHGSCAELATQRWVNDAHRQIVKAACDTEPRAYLEQRSARSHLRIEREVDVVESW